MAILKGKIKTEAGDTLYPETSVDKVIGIDQASVKALYNLGEYDTVDTSNPDYDLVTRATGYKKGRDFTWNYYSAYGFYSTEALPNFTILSGTNVVAPLKTNLFVADTQDNVMASTGQNTIGYVYNAGQLLISTSITSLNDFLAYTQNLVIQYRLSTPYTEKVIKNRPLDTLDQNGSMFVRKEWEKGLNLWNNPYPSAEITSSNVSVSVNGEECVFNGTSTGGFWYVLGTQVLKAGTYTCRNVILSGSVASASAIRFGLRNETYFPLGVEQSTFTLTQDTTFDVVVWFGSSGIVFNNLRVGLMLNEGSTPYPYQPYNGDIVREKDINGTLLWENGNPTSSFASQTITTGDMSVYKYLIFKFKPYTYANGASLTKVEYGSGLEFTLMSATTTKLRSRPVEVSSATSVYFGGAFDDGVQANSLLVPVAIYGTNL